MHLSNTAIICLSPYQGGMEIDSIKLSQLLQSLTNITLIAKKGTFIEKTFHELDLKNTISFKTISFASSFSLSIILNIRKIIKEKDIKNVIFLGASELKSLYFSFIGLDINLIVRHGTTKSSPKKDWFHKLIYSNVNYHITICEHLAKNVKFIIPFGKKTQLKIIYPSLNITPPQLNFNTTKPHHPIRILHVGRIAEGKGQKAAIKACEILYNNNIDFIFNIVGGIHIPYEKDFMLFLSSVPYKDKINLVGHTNAIETYYMDSDIFLFPSDGEGLSNAFIEALTYNLECFSYDNTSFPELQKMGFEFTICADQNISELQGKLLNTVKNYQYHEKNSSLALSSFSKENEINEFLKILI